MKDILYLAIAATVIGLAIAVRHYINKDDEPKNPHGFGNGDDETDYEEGAAMAADKFLKKQ